MQSKYTHTQRDTVISEFTVTQCGCVCMYVVLHGYKNEAQSTTHNSYI
jgi:hypothetical protein